MYKQHLPKLYHCLVRNYQLNNIKLNYIYPRPKTWLPKKITTITQIFIWILLTQSIYLHKEKRIKIKKESEKEK